METNQSFPRSLLKAATREPASVQTGDTLDPCPLQSPNGGYVQIYHPQFAIAPIFSLPKLEYDLAMDRFGVHHGTALWAAQIIACNTVGYLSIDCNGTQDHELHIDSILLADKYFFFPTDGSNDYGVCESFFSWGFPHNSIPAEWISVAQTRDTVFGYLARVRPRDVICRVSGFGDATDVAHLVPETPAEEAWFISNMMWIYNLPNNQEEISHRIHDDANLLLLRKDLHSLFNKQYWAFVPRKGHAIVTFLKYSKDALRLYHGRTTHPLQVDASYVYARFAWSIFSCSLSFTTLPGVTIKIWDASTCEWKLKGKPEQPPSQHPKRKADTQGEASTPKVPKVATRTHQATPSATNLQEEKYIEEIYRNGGGEGGALWESSYYPGIEKVEAKKRRLAKRAYYGLGNFVEEEVDGSNDGSDNRSDGEVEEEFDRSNGGSANRSDDDDDNKFEDMN